MALQAQFTKSIRQVIIFLVGAGILTAVGLAFFRQRMSQRDEPAAARTPVFHTAESDKAVFSQYGGSRSCAACHEEIYRLWASSHHARAERAVSTDLDSGAFLPVRSIAHGSQRSVVSFTNQTFLMTTVGETNSTFRLTRAIGVEPLRQYLVPWHGGRFQSTEIAFAPSVGEWFNVFGQEDRKPGEWGHWTGRGMTWNSMCAACHNTRLRKHYQSETDTYDTTMAEMAVGCEACHGPMASHVHAAEKAKPIREKNHPLVQKGITNSSIPVIYGVSLKRGANLRDPMMSVCGSCHSRRAELTEEFRPGEDFFDHFVLTIPDESEVFYADGQIHEEDYEFTSFLGSRMGAAGVRCNDCHEPHSGKVRLPGNSLCMVCHGAPVPPAPKINAENHTHHAHGSSGDQCVNCHMPQTVYMQRHGRRDHGFTIPDPLLTKQFQIPNACNRCHTNRSTDWILGAVDRWYGSRMERPSRFRAQNMARARALDRKAISDLLSLLRSEKTGFWRAAIVNVLKHWAAEKEVNAALMSSLTDTNALLRSASIRALEPLANSSETVQAALNPRLRDNVRQVRVDAAWALRARVDTNSVAGRELLTYLEHNADQPAGQLQRGVFWLARNEIGRAMACFQRAVQWDPNSAPLHDALAVAFSVQGNTRRAVEELEAACALAPKDGELQFKLGLAYHEDGKPERARGALELAVKLDPNFSRAWYNLGLLYNAAGQADSALESLARAESLDGVSSQIPFTRATILARLGRLDEARDAARRALEVQPGYSEAEELLKSLSTK